MRWIPFVTCREPDVATKRSFVDNLFKLSGEDLAKVIEVLNDRCESCLDKGTALIGQAALQDTMKDIIVDAIDNATFHYANSYVKSLLEKSASAMEVENSTVCYKHETSG